MPSRRAVLACVSALALMTGRANAHAILGDSEPKAGAMVQAGPISFRLRFNSRIDRGRSRLTLSGPGQTKTTLPIGPDGPPDILTTAATLKPGAHVLRWQVLAVDGHITRGDIAFTVTGT